MRQYAAAKSQNPDALLFFRMGDFYELFFEDAQVAARELQITLTARDRERSVPMCGVPYHAADAYLSRLLRKGYRVAICEQMEDPKLTKKIVRREVTRVLTPGTALDPALASERNNYLAALHIAGQVAALALLDLSTGDFRATEFTGPGSVGLCIDELIKAQPSELLLSAGLPPLDPLMEAEIAKIGIAAGAVVHYARSTQQMELQHIHSIRYYERAENLQLDAVSVRNLELIEPLWAGGASEATLYTNLDCCMTPMGKRLLRASLVRPLIDRAEIESRLEAVAVAERSLIDREQLRNVLGAIQDAWSGCKRRVG
jgi:DNA mismatch repair protein MutS